MPISSTEVANIIQSQVGMFSATAQYAQAVSAQYGYQSMGGMGVNDPRAVQSQQALSGGNIGAGLARAPGMALGAAGLASAFGFGPRYIDAFTTAMHAGGAAKRYGGWAGAIGAGAGVFGAGMAIGSGVNWATDQMVFGAQNRGVANAQMGQMFPGNNMNQLGAMSSQVEAMASMGTGSMRQLTALMKQASGTGDIQTGSLTEFQSSFQQLVSKVRNVATVLNQSLTDAYQTMQAVKGMGISGDAAAGFVGTMKGVGMTIGASPQQMMGIASQASQMGRALGMDPGTAATGGLVNAGVYGLAQKKGLIEGLDPGSRQRYTRAAFKFFGSRRGSRVLGAMMSPMGELDPDAAASIAGGSMSAEEITRRYQANIINSPGSLDMLRSRSGELAGQFVSQFGGQGIAPAVRETVESSGSMNPESLTRSLTGLHRRDVAAMEMLANRSSEIRARISQEAKAGFRQGQQSMSISQVVGKAIDQLVKPIRTQFQRIGANISQSVSEAMEDVGVQLSGQRTPGIGGGMNIERVMAIAQATNNPQLAGFLQEGLSGVQGGGWDRFGGRAQPTTGLGRFVRDFAPTGLQLGSYSPGTSPDELPFGGLGLREYQPMQSAALGGLAFGGRGLGWATDHLARGAAGMGRGVSRLAGISGMPWGGHGMISGTARMGTGASWLGLKAAGMVGRMGGALAMPLLAYDAMTNTGPELARQSGMMGLEGITGNRARLVNFLGQAGAFDAPDGTRGYYTADVGGPGGLTPGDTGAGGYTPVGGLIEAGGYGTPGQQNVLTKEGRAAAKEFFAQSGDYSSIRDRLADKIKGRYGGDKDKALHAIKTAMSKLSDEDKGQPGRDITDEKRAELLAEKLGIKVGSEDHRKMLQMAMGAPNFFRKELQVKDKFRNDPAFAIKEVQRQASKNMGTAVLSDILSAKDFEAEAASYLTTPDRVPDVKSARQILSAVQKNFGPKTAEREAFMAASGDLTVIDGVDAVGKLIKGLKGMQGIKASLASTNFDLAGPDIEGKKATQSKFNATIAGLTRGAGAMGLSRAIYDASIRHRRGGVGGVSGLANYIRSQPGWGEQANTPGQMSAEDVARTLLKGDATKEMGLLAPAMAEAQASNQTYISQIGKVLAGERDAAKFTTGQMARSVMSPQLDLKGVLSDAEREYNTMLPEAGAAAGSPLIDDRLSVMSGLIGGKDGGKGLFEGMSLDDLNAMARQGGLSQSRFGQRVGIGAETYARVTRAEQRSTAGGKLNRSKFLNALLPGQRFDRLNAQEQSYLRGSGGGFTPRLERMMLEGAQSLLRSHGVQSVTTAEAESLAQAIASGLHGGEEGMTLLKNRLSTMAANQPAQPGAAGGGGGQATTNLLAGFDKLAYAANEAAGYLGQIGR